jgi:hypothetical protein
MRLRRRRSYYETGRIRLSAKAIADIRAGNEGPPRRNLALERTMQKMRDAGWEWGDGPDGPYMRKP